ASIGLPVRRWGGNAITRYHWQYDTTNRASDYFFENIPNDNPNPENLPNGSASDLFHEQNLRTGTQTLLTVPTIGWLAKARAFDCGFRVSKYGAQQATDEFQPDCGNGVLLNGDLVVGNDPADTSITADPAFIQAWINHLIGRYGNANNGGVRFYNLDNEPFLWNTSHRDVYPLPLGYDGIRDMTYAYGAAVKAADPNAQILGPGDWGWTAYFYSALDCDSLTPGNPCEDPSDRNAHGGIPFLDWYMQQMQAYEQLNGTRLLDYIDVHFYPQNGVALNSDVTPAMAALRLRSTRALWDPTYLDESWINDTVRLIPRLHAWVDDNYPGTKIAIGEYNWGALDTLNGALTQADILGIFGREAVDMALLWDVPGLNDPGAFAFRMYRNYDGAQTRFGETSIQAVSSDQATLAVYAAQRSSDDALTVMVINKTSTDLTSDLTLNSFPVAASAEVYRYSGADLSAIIRQPDQPISALTSLTYPPESITLLVIPINTVATELLVNSGFETEGDAGVPANWTLTNATKDKRKCNKAGKPPVAHSEACAFQFTGTVGVKTTLTQLVPIDGISPGATLVLSGWAYAKNVTIGGKLQVKLKYTDTTKA
ncbi:MAG: glycoside hydrolase family 44 protein, partial [Armatimonadetes bacterium]|nr:glycoside hydrolase family 44 protein [Anaerolineae bacterium]